MKKLFLAIAVVTLVSGNAICAWAQEPVKNNPPATEQKEQNKTEEPKTEEPATSDTPSTDVPQNTDTEENVEQA